MSIIQVLNNMLIEGKYVFRPSWQAQEWELRNNARIQTKTSLSLNHRQRLARLHSKEKSKLTLWQTSLLCLVKVNKGKVSMRRLHNASPKYRHNFPLTVKFLTPPTDRSDSTHAS